MRRENHSVNGVTRVNQGGKEGEKRNSVCCVRVKKDSVRLERENRSVNRATRVNQGEERVSRVRKGEPQC